MKKVLVFIGLLCSVAVYAQKSPDVGYYSGLKFIGADMAFLHYDDISGGLVGVNAGRYLSDRLAFGVAANYGTADFGEKVSVVSGAPFIRYNVILDGPVAVFLQANATVAAVLYDSDTYGVIWPNISSGLSYRLSDHFTAFAKMGLLSYKVFTFGNGFSDGSSSSGDSGEGDWMDEISLEGHDFPIFAGFTKRPTLGIYYTF